MEMNKKPVPSLAEPKAACCGCSACFAVCPSGAITMQPDEKGFPYPRIDETKCIRCNKCISVCRFKKDK